MLHNVMICCLGTHNIIFQMLFFTPHLQFVNRSTFHYTVKINLFVTLKLVAAELPPTPYSAHPFGHTGKGVYLSDNTAM